MACLAGLYSYWENSKSIILDSKCLDVNFIWESERMNLDFMTSQNLELTYNLKNFNNKSTLSALFHTETEAGSKSFKMIKIIERLLRTNILNPLNVPEKIRKRQEVVAELKSKALYRSEVKSVISKFK